MAVTYAYPTVVPELQDLLVGTEISEQGGEDAPRTRTFTIGSIVTLATDSVAGIYAAKTGATFTGTITAPTIIKTGGTSLQTLRADGSVTTNGPLSRSYSNIYQTAAGALSAVSTIIPYSIFATGDILSIVANISSTAVIATAVVDVKFYINSTPDTAGSPIQIATYNFAIGDQNISVERIYWNTGTAFTGRSFTSSAVGSTGTASVQGLSTTSTTIPSQFYIVVVATTTGANRVCINSVIVEKK